MADGQSMHAGATDLARLMSGELLYTGATRTPVCAVTGSVMVRGTQVPLAAEQFATMLDAHLLTGSIQEDANSTDTADGRPATRQHSLNRMAHMLCCDRTDLLEEELVDIANQLISEQVRQIGDALRNAAERVSSDDGKPTIVLSGSGSFLGRKAVEHACTELFGEIFELAQMYRTDVSTSACAFAVARLAAERCLYDLIPDSGT